MDRDAATGNVEPQSAVMGSSATKRPPNDRFTNAWREIEEPEQRLLALRALQDGYDRYRELAFGSQLQAAAVLNWAVVRLGMSWIGDADEGRKVMVGLRERLTTAYKTNNIFSGALASLCVTPEEVNPQAVMDAMDVGTYKNLMQRQHHGLRMFHNRFVPRKYEHLRPLLPAFPTLLVFILVSLWRGVKNAAAGTAAAIKTLSSRHRAATAVSALLGLAVIVWYLGRCNPLDEGSDRAATRVTPDASVGDTSDPDPQRADAAQMSADEATQLTPPGNDVRALRPLMEEPFFQLKTLGQSMTMNHVPGRAPSIPTQGWRRQSALDVVPAEYQDQWSRVQELDRRASEQARAGGFRAALATFEELLTETDRRDGWNELSVTPDVAQYIFTALGRRIGLRRVDYNSPFDGPAVLGMTQYETGRGYEDHGQYTEALESYASSMWRGLIAPASVRIARAASFAASNWGFLLNVGEMYDDARARAARLAAELVSAERAVLSDDGLAVWFTGAELRAAWIDPILPEVCDVGEPGPDHPAYHLGQAWKVSTEYDGVWDEQTSLAHLNASIVHRPATAPSTPRRAKLIVHRSLEATRIRECVDIVVAVEFCFMSDGRLLASNRCL
ncbi:MAG: hypothetical protein ABL886_00975 [Rhodoglobus sp.]